MPESNRGWFSRVWLLIPLIVSCVAVGCSGDSALGTDAPQAIGAGQGGGGGQSGGGAGAASPTGPMPGLGMMMPETGGAGAGTAGAAASGGHAGAAGAGGAGAVGAGAAGMAGSGGMAGGAGAAGQAGAAGGGGSPSGSDPTSVCMGGEVGMDSDSVTTRALSGSRNLAAVIYSATPPNRILSFKTTLIVPKTPERRATLFIWPGLQPRGGSDPGRIGNGVLQPVLTWGPSCLPGATSPNYTSWWIAGMYVNISTGAAGPTGCAGGDSMDTPVGDRLYIDISVDGMAWTQTITNLDNMETVDFTIDLEGQDQNWAIWDIEVPTAARPAEDTIFEKSVLTFSDPVTSCQPSIAAEVDYFSAPVLSPDGLNCCYDRIILKQMR